MCHVFRKVNVKNIDNVPMVAKAILRRGKKKMKKMSEEA
jgi:hypothetical protein